MKTKLLIIIGIILIIAAFTLFVYDVKYEGWGNNEMFYMDGKMICDKVWFQNPQNCKMK